MFRSVGVATSESLPDVMDASHASIRDPTSITQGIQADGVPIANHGGGLSLLTQMELPMSNHQTCDLQPSRRGLPRHVILMAGGLMGCMVEPGPTWVLQQADIVALEVRRFGDTTLIAGGAFSPIDDTATVQQGTMLSLTAISRGSSSCRRGDLFESSANGNDLTIRLIDSVLTGENVACTDDLAPLNRHLQHVLSDPGNAQITVLGVPPARVTFTVTQ